MRAVVSAIMTPFDGAVTASKHVGYTRSLQSERTASPESYLIRRPERKKRLHGGGLDPCSLAEEETRFVWRRRCGPQCPPGLTRRNRRLTRPFSTPCFGSCEQPPRERLRCCWRRS